MRTLIRHKPVSVAPSEKGFPLTAAMELDPNGSTIHLRGRRYVHLRRALGWTVQAVSGMVWVTQDDDLRDIVLQAGESFTLDRNGGALLSPIGEAEFLLERKAGMSAATGISAPRSLSPFSSLRALFA
ncbi:DUF2917 domain-containing protein [Noviherbaspirillum massiliense]|uniref:DUF2917 domain-containing protein n=1 Tax=Noviherbaspirillum massiliense TaxID=1465823 RepID=UPI000319CCCB|nr:DUF2917 domain-containing protein [Noviherbaspirillum massiliense]